ncbi:MAG: transcription-repair coupling factor [bacterium]
MMFDSYQSREQVSVFARSLALLREGQRRLRILGLPGSSPAFMAASVMRELSTPVLILCPEDKQAAALAEDARFYLQALGMKKDAFHLSSRPPYQALPGSFTDARSAALAAMAGAGSGNPVMVSASAEAALATTMSPDLFADRLYEVSPGALVDRDEFLKNLVSSGYTAVSSAMEPGDFSVRGGIMDVYPPGVSRPVRIELWDEEVESLRAFDPDTQKSEEKIDSVLVPPLKEIFMSDPEAEKAAMALRDQARQWKEDPHFKFDKTRLARKAEEIAQRIERKDHFPAAESFLPLFYEQKHCALDYLDRNWTTLYLDPFLCDQAITRKTEELEEEWEREMTEEGFALPPFQHFVSRNHAERSLAPAAVISTGLEHGALQEEKITYSHQKRKEDTEIRAPSMDTGQEPLPGTASSLEGYTVDNRLEKPLEPFINGLSELMENDCRVIAVSPFAGKADRLQDLLSDHDIHLAAVHESFGILESEVSRAVTAGVLHKGFVDRAGGLAFFPEAEVFGEKIRPARKPPALEAYISDLSDLSEGEYVVHEEHGVALYRGMQSLDVQWAGDWDFVREKERPRIRMDCARLEYSGGAMLYVPVHRINQIGKYRGATDTAPSLDTLGGTSWERLKQKVKRSVREFAQYLLRIYASRQVHGGTAFPPPDSVFREFEEGFAYEETPDQLQAIEDVLDDMVSEKPMDRLVCGDVGYGKTEVALRAAFLAAMSGRQVAVLVPTTILAQQHYETFTTRLSKYPIEVRSLSRFLSKKEQTRVLEEIVSGKADIVIGTHRLLSKDVTFHELGLLIIDEEHRFGVRHKERLRELKATVDTLILTATPIPRTLHMSLAGLRDMSVINTPPPDRLAVHTELLRDDDRIIKEAIERELRRGGQAFFVHNRVQTIEPVLDRVQKLAPQARVALAHGQMKGKDLERIMSEFIQGRYDVLVCSAIIQSGLDIPRVNTMLINRADQFGLAQLYQLRGRIGRAKARGYCYLLVPAKGTLTKDAAKRLRVLREFSELGSGFRIAARDLEIRGAGNLLGSEQTGHISRVGMELYLKLLQDEVNRIKGEAVESEIEPEINLPVPAFLSEEYVPDQNQRLSWYKRLSRAKNDYEVDALSEELEDRYGKPPEAARNLLEIARLKGGLKRLNALELAYTGTEVSVRLSETGKADHDRVIELATSHPDKCRVTPENRLFYKLRVEHPAELFPAIRSLLNDISTCDNIFAGSNSA